MIILFIIFTLMTFCLGILDYIQEAWSRKVKLYFLLPIYIISSAGLCGLSIYDSFNNETKLSAIERTPSGQYKIAGAIVSGDPVYYNQKMEMADKYKKQGKFKEALDLVNQAGQLDKENESIVLTRHLRAEIFMGEGNYKDALSELSQINFDQVSKDNKMVYLSDMKKCYFELNDYKKMVEYEDKINEMSYHPKILQLPT